MKLIFIALENRNDPTSIGPSLKIEQQRKALEYYGFDVYEVQVKNKYIYIKNKGNSEKIYKFNSRSILKNDDNKFRRKIKILRRLQETYKILIEYIENEGIKISYVRNLLPWNPFALKFVKNVRKLSDIMILDVPTYPYEKEFSKAIRMIDGIFNKNLNRYFDFVVTPSNVDNVYGIKTLKITNGIDVEKFRKKAITKKEKELHLIGVANVSIWHGYDRVIRGLYEYYKRMPKMKVYFHVVGEGVELSNLKKLSEKLGVGDYVLFHGFKTGEELDKLFDLSDVAVGSLGLHRIGLKNASIIKLREYCARGIPFVITANDEDFINFEFMLKISSDENPLDIREVINFYERIKNTDYVINMRDYAMKNLSWKSKMKILVDEINNLLENKKRYKF